MRERKYRIWCVREQMFYEHGFSISQDGLFWYDDNEVERAFNPETYILSDWIGLLDKNGVEIYEGDIFQVAANKKYIVKYMECGNSNYELVGATFVLWFNDELFFPFDEYAMNTGEVIGHIYSTKTA